MENVFYINLMELLKNMIFKINLIIQIFLYN